MMTRPYTSTLMRPTICVRCALLTATNEPTRASTCRDTQRYETLLGGGTRVDRGRVGCSMFVELGLRTSSKAGVRSTAAASTSTCVTQSLRVQGGRQGGGGSGVAHGDVEIRNVGATTCTLIAPHSVVFLTANRQSLAVRFTSATSTVPGVTIPPGQVALLGLSWTNWCKDRPGPLTIAIIGASHGGTMSGPFNGPPDYDFVPACLARNTPSTVQIVSLELQI